MQYKPGVKRIGSPTQLAIEQAVSKVLESTHALPALVTSANDGQHMKGSGHYTNEAEDISLRVIVEALTTELRAALGKGYDVIFESDKYVIHNGQLKQVRWSHWHIERDPK